MSKRRFLTSFRNRKKIETQWTADFATGEITTAAAGIGAASWVVPADYQDTATLEPGGTTLLRIRGWLAYRATVIGCYVRMGIWASQSDSTGITGTHDPSALAGVINGELLWWMGDIAPIDTSRRLEIDVKAKRKLENHYIHFTIAPVAQAVAWVAGARLLLRNV